MRSERGDYTPLSGHTNDRPHLPAEGVTAMSIKQERMWDHVPLPGGKITVLGLAMELGAPIAQIMRLVQQRVSKQQNLAALSPASLLGPNLAKAIRQTVAPPER